MTSGQRILAKNRIARQIFSRGKVNVTLTSQYQCSQLQQSCWYRIFCCVHRSSDHASQWAGQPPKLPLPLGVFGPPSNTWYLGFTRVIQPNVISIGLAVFAGSRTCPTNRQTDRHTDHATPSAAIGRMLCTEWMRCSLKQYTVSHAVSHKTVPFYYWPLNGPAMFCSLASVVCHRRLSASGASAVGRSRPGAWTVGRPTLHGAQYGYVPLGRHLVLDCYSCISWYIFTL